jgi:hypothetical protein
MNKRAAVMYKACRFSIHLINYNSWPGIPYYNRALNLLLGKSRAALFVEPWEPPPVHSNWKHSFQMDRKATCLVHHCCSFIHCTSQEAGWELDYSTECLAMNYSWCVYFDGSAFCTLNIIDDVNFLPLR